MRIVVGLLLAAGLITLPVLGFASKCNQHMCPVAQDSYEAGYEVVSKLSFATADESELE